MSLLHGTIAILIALGSSTNLTSELVVFGPETYSRGTGSPTPVVSTFEVATSTGSFELKMVNHGVTSAVITLNGRTVLRPNDFIGHDKNGAILSRQVSLLSGTNVIGVELRSKPGTSLVLSIVRPSTNTPPVADAGTDQTVAVDTRVQLSGTGSTDADGDRLSYLWSFESRPARSASSLLDPTSAAPTFVTDVPGTYVVRLVVNDGVDASAPDTVVVSTVNSAPVASAGPDQTARVGTPVSLDGSRSSDIDGDTITYAWTLLSAPTASSALLNDAAAIRPTFTIDVAGSYVFQLVVNDGTSDGAPDTVVVTTTNAPPVANAGPDSTATVTATVTLDGSASSDVDGDLLVYAWSLISVPSGSAATLSDRSAIRPMFVVDRAGTYIAQLIVNDGMVASAPDTVTIVTTNSAPLANAGPDQSTIAGRGVTLDGSASYDVDGDALTYQWSLATIPVGSTTSLVNPTALTPTFVVDLPGTYVAQLVVHDGVLGSAPDTVTITTTNSTPTANAGSDQSGIAIGTVVSLDGSASIDPDGHILSYSWALIARPATSISTLNDSTGPHPTFTPDVAGDYVAQLIVNDGFVNSAPDTVLIRTNANPIAEAGPDQYVLVGSTVLLDGAGSSDPEGSTLTYQWSFTSTPTGSTATLLFATTATPTFVPDRAGTYIAELTVTDDRGATSVDAVTIIATSPPVVTLLATNPSASEGGSSPGTITVRRSGDLSGELSVFYTITGSATNGTDYETLSGNVTIAAGQPSSIITITPIDDVIVEGTETVVLTLSADTAYIVGLPDVAALTISDNDFPLNRPPQAANDAYTVTGRETSITLPSGFEARRLFTGAPLANVTGLALDDAGALFIADWGPGSTNGQVFKLPLSSRTPSSLVSGLPLSYPAMMLIGDGRATLGRDLIVADHNSIETNRCCDGRVFRINRSTGALGVVARGAGGFRAVGDPFGIALGPGGAFGSDLYVMDFQGASTEPPVLYRVDANGATSIFASNSAIWTTTQFPQYLAFANGNAYGNDLYVGDRGDGGTPSIWRVASDGTISPFLQGTSIGRPGSLRFAPGGVFGTDLYFVDISYPGGPALKKALPDGSVEVFATNLPGGGDGFDFVFAGDGHALYVGTRDSVFEIKPSTAQASLDVPSPGVLANDSDPDGDHLASSAVTIPAHGAAILRSNGSLTYVPEPGFIGTDAFIYRASDGRLDSNNATVAIRVVAPDPVNQPPYVTAGPDFVSTSSTTALHGSVSDDGLPTGATLSTTWAKITGPGDALFVDANSPTTAVTFSVPGTYVLRLSVSDSLLSSSSVVTISASFALPLPFVSVSAPDPNASEAGPEGGAFTISRSGDPSNPLTVFYSVGGSATNGVDYAALSGSIVIPAGLSSAAITVAPIDDSAVEDLEVVVLTLTPNASYIVGIPDVATVAIADNDVPVVNAAPVVNAGADQSISLPARPLPTSYTLTFLPGRGGATVTANINDLGEVVGSSADASGQFQPALWRAGSLIQLPTLGGANGRAMAINIAGLIGGQGQNAAGEWRDFFYNAGTLTDFARAFTSSCCTWMMRMNRFGDLVGLSDFNPILYRNGQATFLPGLQGSTGGHASGINDSGLIGGIVVLGSALSPVQWVNGQVSALPTLGVSSGSHFVYGLNNFGEISGLVGDPSGGSRAALWRNGQLVDIGRFGGTQEVASFINDRHEMLVSSAADTWLWRDGAMLSLRPFVATFWPNLIFTGLNNSGQIAGYLGVNSLDASARAFILNPQRGSTQISVTLTGTAVDDGLPAGSLQVFWSKATGPGDVTFSDANSRNTTATFSKAGTYVLRLTADDSLITSTDDITVTVTADPADNEPPTVDAGADQSVSLASSASLQGSVSDDGLPSGGMVTYAWWKLSGPGTVTFSASNQLATTASFSANGTYVLRLVANDGILSNADDITVVVSDGSQNQAPAVNAGPDQTVTLPGGVTLIGSVVDDGLPAGQTLTVSWTQDSGPAVATFLSPTLTVTGVTFTAPGTYVFRLTATDQQLTSTDEVSVLVSAATPAITLVAPNSGVQGQSGPITIVGANTHFVQGSTTVDLGPGITVSSLTVTCETCLTAQVSIADNAPTGPHTVSVTTGTEVVTLSNGFSVLSGSPTLTSLTPALGQQGQTLSVHVTGRFTHFDQATTRVDLGSGIATTGIAVASATDLTAQVAISSGAAVGSRTLTVTTGTEAASVVNVFTVQPAPIVNQPPVLHAGSDQSATFQTWELLVSSYETPYTGTKTEGVIRYDGLTGALLSPLSLAPARTGLRNPAGITIGPDKNIYVQFDDLTSAHSSIVRYSRTTGESLGSFVSPGAGGFGDGGDLTFGPDGNLYVADWSNSDVKRFNGTTGEFIGSFATMPAGRPSGLLFGPDGSLYVSTGAAILRFDGATGQFLQQFASNNGTGLNFIGSFVWGPDGNVYAAGGDSNNVGRFNGTTGAFMGIVVPPGSGGLSRTGYLTFGPDGNLYVANVPLGGGPGKVLRYNGTTGAFIDVFVPEVSGGLLGATGLVFRRTGDPVALAGSATDDGVGGPLAITWSKVSGPGNVTFADANAASTTATFSEVGTYTLRLTASDGALSSSDDVSVVVSLPNFTPAVDAGLDQIVALPATATLAGVAFDDGRPTGSALAVAWSKVSGPGEVVFANPNTRATTASFETGGSYVLRLTATDGVLSSVDDMAVTVTAVPASIASVAPNIGQQGQANLAVVITGQNTHFVQGITTVSLGGAGVVINGVTVASPTSLTANVSITPNALLGARPLIVTTGAEVVGLTNAFTVQLATNHAPTITMAPTWSVTLPARLTLNYTVTDDGLPLGGALTVSWEGVSGPGNFGFQNQTPTSISVGFDQPGTYVLRVTATDTQFTVSADVTVTVNAPIAAPVVSITTPTDGAEITSPINVVGNVVSAALVSWTLDFRSQGEPAFRTLATGSTPITNGVLGTLDPTLLLNGLAEIRLRAVDAAGQTSVFGPITVVVTQNQKIGNFTVSFNDLTVPVAGLPIQIVRTYDSRDRRPGDFGVGWRLDLSSVAITTNGPLGENWTGTSSGGLIPNLCIVESRPHLVTVSFSDGTVFQFRPTLNPNCQQLIPLSQTTVTFAPVSTTPPNASLAVIGNSDPYVAGNSPGPVDLLDLDQVSTFDPQSYRLTMPDGRVLIINIQSGLQTMSDLNGNVLTITPSGVTHSSGKRVAFQRDGSNRITQITDPAGNAIHYTYNGQGDLVSVTDAGSNVTTFTYNATHGLLTIVDPRGVQPIRNVYDDSGRLVQHVDAFGNTIDYTHDLNTRQELVRDRLGNLTVNEYDDRGNVVRVTDARGGVTRRTYDVRNNLLTETNPLSEARTYTYDGNNNRLTETDPLGNTATYTYNARNQVLTMRDALGRVTSNTYDANGNLTQTTDPMGRVTTNVYDSRGLRTSVTDPAGNVTTYQYDGSGNLTRQTVALGHATTYTYDANGNRITESKTQTTSSGARTVLTQYQYDAQNRLTRTIYPDGSSTRTVYNAIGKQASTFDQLGRQTDYTYDLMGRLTSTGFPDGTTESSTYDAEGHRLTSTDRAGRVTRYAYDALGRLTTTTFSDNATNSTQYNAAGQVIGSTDARGNNTSYAYDAAGRRTSVTDALGHVTSFAYDASGNQLSITDANGHATQFQYDGNNRRLRTVHTDSTADSVVYDALGRTTSKTDQAGVTTRFEYDALGRLTAVIDALNQRTSYTYDELGNRISQTDANNHATTFAYDAMGRRVGRTLPLGITERFTYDAAGNVATKTDFNGRTTTYVYDTANRLTTKSPDPVLAEPTVRFSYNAAGQRTQMVDASGTTNYSYDVRGRLTTKATPQGTLSYTYDTANNLTSIRSSHTGGTSVDYAYDALNRLSTVTDNRLTSGVTTYAYDNVGNLASFHYPNGVTHSYTYNALNRLNDLAVTNSTTTLASYAYTLGATGNRTRVLELGGRAVDYTYDSLYRLTAEAITGATGGTTTYAYDPVGNRLARSSPTFGLTNYSYDANDRLTTDTYDANGNTTASGGNSHAYDFENRLTNQNGGNVSIVYDGDGNRVANTFGGVTTRYLVDDRNLTGYAQVLEEMSGNTVERIYSYGLNRISQSQPSGTTFYCYDGHGSVRLLSDDTGTGTDRYVFDAFGNVLNESSATFNRYLYAGEQFDPSVGAYYLRARYYAPSIGRFVTPDSIAPRYRDPASLHRYVYTHNDPIDFVDSSGNVDTLAGVVTANAITAALAQAAFITYKQGFDALFTPKGEADVAIATLAGAVGGVAGSGASAAIARYYGARFLTTFAAGSVTSAASGLLSGVASEFLRFAIYKEPVSLTDANGRVWVAYFGGFVLGGLSVELRPTFSAYEVRNVLLRPTLEVRDFLESPSAAGLKHFADFVQELFVQVIQDELFP